MCISIISISYPDGRLTPSARTPSKCPCELALSGKWTAREKGVSITTSAFSANVIDYVEKIDPMVMLIDGSRLADLMIDFNVGVTLVQYTKRRKSIPATSAMNSRIWHVAIQESFDERGSDLINSKAREVLTRTGGQVLWLRRTR